MLRLERINLAVQGAGVLGAAGLQRRSDGVFPVVVPIGQGMDDGLGPGGLSGSGRSKAIDGAVSCATPAIAGSVEDPVAGSMAIPQPSFALPNTATGSIGATPKVYSTVSVQAAPCWAGDAR